MVLLDPEQAYILQGAAEDGQKVESEEIDHPKILHLKLSAPVLEAIIANQNGLNSARLTSFSGGNPLLLVNEERHSLHYTAESNPHQLYAFQAGSSNLRKIGSVSSKLSIGPESQTSSSATTRLKERREQEEARKTEHRTVLLETAPSSARNRPVSSTSKLKLRAKGLAPPSTNSPLIRSRANTPNETFSRPGSPSLGLSNIARTPPTTSPALLSLQSTSIKASPLSRSIKIVPSPPSILRQLIQLLAMGPILKRDIFQQMHQPESTILPLLEQMGQVAPEYLQPKAAPAKRISVPANRRSLVPGQAPTSNQNGERGASLLYILKDELYCKVTIGEWADYKLSERLLVSEHMEAALKRLGIKSESEEWKRLYPDGRAGKTVTEAIDSHIEDNGAIDDVMSMKREASGSSADSLSKTDAVEDAMLGTQSNKKKSNQDRLRSMKKNAKGRTTSRTCTPTPTTSKAANAKKTKIGDGKDEEDVTQDQSAPSKSEAAVAAAPPPRSTTKETNPSLKTGKTTKTITSRASSTQKTATQPKPAASRKEIEYTDSSDDEEMQLDDPPLLSKKAGVTKNTANHLVAPKMSSNLTTSSSSPDGKKSRQGVGSGAAFSSEPWLDVRSHGDWKRLAERFKRVYEEFLIRRSRLENEEISIRADLEQARSEAIKSESSLQIEDEREEGEASPLDGPTRGILTMDFDPPSFANVTWRSGTISNTDKVATTKPTTYKDLERQVLKLKEMQVQLTRMKGALQTSKKALEINDAA